IGMRGRSAAAGAACASGVREGIVGRVLRLDSRLPVLYIVHPSPKFLPRFSHYASLGLASVPLALTYSGHGPFPVLCYSTRAPAPSFRGPDAAYAFFAPPCRPYAGRAAGLRRAAPAREPAAGTSRPGFRRKIRRHHAVLRLLPRRRWPR